MVFQKPNPFPMTVYDNIACGPYIHGLKNKNQFDEIVENSLQQAGRISDKTAFFLTGDMVEYGVTKDIFFSPGNKQTEDYISGKSG